MHATGVEVVLAQLAGLGVAPPDRHAVRRLGHLHGPVLDEPLLAAHPGEAGAALARPERPVGGRGLHGPFADQCAVRAQVGVVIGHWGCLLWGSIGLGSRTHRRGYPRDHRSDEEVPRWATSATNGRPRTRRESTRRARTRTSGRPRRPTRRVVRTSRRSSTTLRGPTRA